jgi:hypothetical protein
MATIFGAARAFRPLFQFPVAQAQLALFERPGFYGAAS